LTELLGGWNGIMKTKFILVMVFLMPFVGVAKADTVDDYKKACDGGVAEGCFNLGVTYFKGRGVKEDYFAAADWYKKACDGGVAKGCVGLGLLYEYGQGVKQDYFIAADLYKKACDDGVAGGCIGLGGLYSNG
jgi:TPR repeat protein